ncbi:hypothetical protein ACQYRI_18010 [Salmonella enterica]
MKLLPVNRTIQFILLLLLLIIIATPAIVMLRPTQAALEQTGETRFQFGFYDLKLQQKELYNSRMSTKDNKTIMSDISGTEAEGTDLVLKGKFVQTNREGEMNYFSYKPTWFVHSKESQMLDSNIDLLANAELWMQQFSLDNVPLVSMQNGMIFIYPLNK